MPAYIAISLEVYTLYLNTTGAKENFLESIFARRNSADTDDWNST
jgi:hypothetical protein